MKSTLLVLCIPLSSCSIAGRYCVEDAKRPAACWCCLVKRYEEQLFSQASQHSKVVPVLVLTGFLGSGKTTLLQHLLDATGHELKLGVLVNEVAALDVDGQLLSTTQSNAAAGIKAAQLAGGCACCSVSSNLQAALHELAGSSSYQQLDYLLLETSGVADVEPLASMLTSSGFKLAGVVTVVDAEAGSTQLQHEDVALAQLRAADVVVLNKCDLASLSALSAVEDLIQQKAPGVRMLRARFGQVPPEALLDVDVEEEGGTSGADDQQQQQAQQTVQGEIAFLSHEPVVATSKLKGRPRAGSLVSSQRAAKLKADGEGGRAVQQPHSHSHSHSHSSFVSVSFTSSQPLCMACFQAYVANSLLVAPALFRAKGFVWFEQQRHLQYIFHVSGKQRAECGATGSWQGPPGVQLVLIGQDQQQLLGLREQLQDCLATCCSCSTYRKTISGSATGEHAVHRPKTDALQDSQVPQQQRQQQQESSHGDDVPPGLQQRERSAAADAFAQAVQQHHRFELWQQPQLPGQAQQQHSQQQGSEVLQGCDGGGEALSGLVQFTAMGSALHGVIAEEVNAAVLRKANATPGCLFMCHIKSPPALRTAAVSGQQVAYQGVLALQLCFKPADRAEYGAQQWRQLEAALAPVLRKAYQHVHNCKCDIVQLLSAA